MKPSERIEQLVTELADTHYGKDWREWGAQQRGDMQDRLRGRAVSAYLDEQQAQRGERQRKGKK